MNLSVLSVIFIVPKVQKRLIFVSRIRIRSPHRAQFAIRAFFL